MLADEIYEARWQIARAIDDFCCRIGGETIDQVLSDPVIRELAAALHALQVVQTKLDDPRQHSQAAENLAERDPIKELRKLLRQCAQEPRECEEEF